NPLSRPRRTVRIFPVKRRTKAGPFEKRKTRSRIRSAVSDAPRRTARQRLFHGDRHRIVRNENCQHPKKERLMYESGFRGHTSEETKRSGADGSGTLCTTDRKTISFQA
ncbi:hypothetical protein, partial [Alistipes communis]|uniref:hypothetical protein n=1 Tax=Alistipes communis TaxID=2585118 RepID=UPI003AF74CD5